ncbi:hypothetical protein [Flavobacterium caeni]|uniref:Alpha-ketoglutarate decarboxylase n=1 Tax=Flavobacterium caeni TaxID=490189 RepID=A0A1G5EJC2_9FLAO|nr:hypothetical protein [Flavobacterium caeni]SCY27067.1 hypothetical protein SAMN02927903_01078 [Flavobacterium caeni]
MTRPSHTPLRLFLILTLLFLALPKLQAQQTSAGRWQFGGGIGANFGSGFTNITLAPGAIYNFNQYVAAGVGLQGSYVRSRNYYESYIYGGSLLGLFTPIPQVQLSAELEQLRVNTTYDLGYQPFVNGTTSRERNFWNTALYLGAGYRVQNVTIGVRYNVLFDDDDGVYSEPFMPFIRVYF